MCFIVSFDRPKPHLIGAVLRRSREAPNLPYALKLKKQRLTPAAICSSSFLVEPSLTLANLKGDAGHNQKQRGEWQKRTRCGGDTSASKDDE